LFFQFIHLIKKLTNLKNILTSSMILLVSAGLITLQSCHKTETALNDLSPAAIPSSKSSGGGGTGGGGNSGGGHNGGGSGGGVVVTPPTPTDTTTSLLPVADIITVGQWKISSFVQGNDNNTSLFSSYIFTFNPDGTMIADDGNGNQTMGGWHYQEAVFYYGIPVYGSSPYGFTMTFGVVPLTMLNENYFISKKTLSTIYIDSINPNENAHIILSKI
jgi:hypothetical protein